MSTIETQHPTTHVPEVTEDLIFPSGEIESDEPELESYRHLAQLMLLLNSLEWHWQSRQDFFAAGNLSIYYTPPAQNAPRDRGPDFFVAINTEGKPRKSWVVWQEGGKYPDAMRIAFVGLVIIIKEKLAIAIPKMSIHQLFALLCHRFSLCRSLN
ncbi:Uma2 family endonuclease [Roseofilum reptotaenium CS-1145]|uniref:Uncharacterized protein n=1 Tax=Roseofilum reptotaenium AO1-A TaxID=1925591 RepID=A0A1L9QQU1_9CYAN|nr:Uma2 family endonuclease [Roseofilum reptotaenium]MDB9516060.1 Uma2 family endonuclease [Roseofilum reptotaenium CS-1145]OJJ25013.1 hypothetical protein BI308_13300 [Roseofilum reptotaenium AO1-A]